MPSGEAPKLGAAESATLSAFGQPGGPATRSIFAGQLVSRKPARGKPAACRLRQVGLWARLASCIQ
eukprot:5332450-Alexandrium_andersonii.AAC.1